jgi:hypothetical protein
MNKRAIEKSMTIWWFAVWLIIIASVIVYVSIFASRNIDLRFVESDILARKALLCIKNNFNEFNSENFNFYAVCGFDENIFNSEKFAVRVIVMNSGNSIIKKEDYGKPDIFEQCDVKETIKNAKYYPECASRKISLLVGNEEKYLLVKAGSNQFGARVLNKNLNLE